MDELCISQRRNLWLWTAVSRYTGQILAYILGDRGWDRVAELYALLPRVYQRRLVYTDGYGAYADFFSAWQHLGLAAPRLPEIRRRHLHGRGRQHESTSPMQFPGTPPLRSAGPQSQHREPALLRRPLPQRSL